MTIKTSGSLSLTEIKNEFLNLTNPDVSFSDLLGIAEGVPDAGPLSLSIMYGKTFVYLKVITSNVTNLNVQSLFTTLEWNSETPKEVLISPSVTVGSTSTSTPALTIPNTGAGPIKINNEGSIIGAGALVNTSAGGNAILVSRDNVTIRNVGLIAGGGGAGGAGGVGGQGGQGSNTFADRDPDVGYYYSTSPATYYKTDSNRGIYQWYWQGVLVASGSGSSKNSSNATYPGTYVAGTYRRVTTYTRIQSSEDVTEYIYYYELYRTNFNTTNYFSGGAGGAGSAGGRGAGYNQSLVIPGLGTAGSAGGTNAGTGGRGGTGGAGGDLGLPGVEGATGATGSSGNYTAGLGGSAGQAGSAPGRAITGNARTLINTGTILGTVNV